eukprot:6212800-Pleurochrysis_carterae.AAC.1
MAPIPSQFAALGRLPFRGPGCTGIIAVADDGVVYHARNLDFAPRRIMQDLVYTGIFTRNGTEVRELARGDRICAQLERSHLISLELYLSRCISIDLACQPSISL